MFNMILKRKRYLNLKMSRWLMKLFVMILPTLFAMSLSKAETLQDLANQEFPIELAEENLPLYITYLRLNQNQPIQGIELMGGMGIKSFSEDGSGIIYHFKALFLFSATATKPTKISYISSFQGAVQTADVVWHPCEYGIYPAVVEFYVPSSEDIPQQRLFISADGEIWYAYTLYDKGLASYFVRESALPMEVNDDGYPVSQTEKLLRKFSEQE